MFADGRQNRSKELITSRLPNRQIQAKLNRQSPQNIFHTPAETRRWAADGKYGSVFRKCCEDLLLSLGDDEYAVLSCRSQLKAVSMLQVSFSTASVSTVHRKERISVEKLRYIVFPGWKSYEDKQTKIIMAELTSIALCIVSEGG
jgi:hypothetical protein